MRTVATVLVFLVASDLLAIIRADRDSADDVKGKCKKQVPARPNPDGTLPDPPTIEIDVCCKGYKPYQYDPSKCVPDCPDGCENGFCVAPNICDCFQDHVRSFDDKCVPTCPISCHNGVCHSNGTCSCNPRHVLDISKKFCFPMCRGSCGINRYCSSPGKCSCVRRFRENPDTGECDPICPMNCLHGRCLSPGICACKPGYRLIDDVCQAECSNCENGKCVMKDVCACNPGYTFDTKTHKCEPVCTQCSNGVCVAPGICECKDGFEKDNGKCVPKCDGGCPNGYCVAPETCNCREGYARNIFGKCRRLRCTIVDDTTSLCSIKHIGS